MDLAWSERAGSGVCVVDATGTILHEDQLSPADLVDWVRAWRGERSVLAIDGLLVVPAGGPVMRPVERQLHRRYGRFHAGPFPGGAASLAMRGRSASPAATLVAAVGATVVDPTDRTAPHRAIEVFPAPSWIEVFRLSERIAYKHVRRAERHAVLGRLLDLLDTLRDADPPLRAAEPDPLRARLAAAATTRQVKAVEDILDARLCAWVALTWGRGDLPHWVLSDDGDWRHGYVVVPQLHPALDAAGRDRQTLRQ